MSSFTYKLDYQFQDPGLLKQALRHRSAGKPNNERMEFLGDAVLGLIISEVLYLKFPSASEGELSRFRSQLVQQATLAAVARDLGLGEVLQLGLGELKSGGAERESILADALEALLSAIYLDGGMSACRYKVEQWLLPQIEKVPLEQLHKDPKTRLQELMQARKQPLPVYTVLAISGTGHQQMFKVECQTVLSPFTGLASASNRKDAEQLAAALVLERLEPVHGNN